VRRSHQQKWIAGLPVIGILWLLSAALDRLWFFLDRSVPAWDQADYLTGCLNYWHALQTPQWFSQTWWTELWLLSSKIPPFTYLATAFVFNLFGTGVDQATIVNLLFTAILLLAVYGLGTCLFSIQVGLWAAGLCLLFPALYLARLDFLLDYPLTAMVALSFCCLTLWRSQFLGKKPENKKKKLEKKETGANQPTNSLRSWLWAIAFGVSLGLAFLVKQPALFFLFVPILWTGVSCIWQRRWGRLLQLGAALLVAGCVMFPWYRTNWLLMLTAGKRATVDSAIAEGDPPLNTIEAWIFYLKDLPYVVSWLLLVVSIVGLLLYWRRAAIRIPELGTQAAEPLDRDKLKQGKTASDSHSRQNREAIDSTIWRSMRWLAVFLIGAYLLCSLNINKDSRYVMPYLPVVAVLLAYGLLLLPGRRLRWGAVILATVIMLLNVLPVPPSIAGLVQSPRTHHPPFLGTPTPNTDIIAEIVETEPYLQTNLGVLPSTPSINQHNLNFYGALSNFQVYGRQVGTRLKQVTEDARSLPWFLTKSGDQGSIRQPEALAAITQLVEQSGDFTLKKTWTLADGDLKLYQRRFPTVEVQPIANAQELLSRVKLNRITVPEQAPAGKPIAITYQWSGSWEPLRSGIVLLTWQLKDSAECSDLSAERKTGNHGAIAPETTVTQTPKQCWLHDHGIAMGRLQSSSEIDPKTEFQVVERTAMLPPASIAPGQYNLKALYLNRQTGETHPIEVPPVSLTITPTAPSLPAPELDFVTQLRLSASKMPEGLTGLTEVFDRVGQINQYDPVQDYLKQAQAAFSYRLQQSPHNLDFAYGLALAEVLQRRVDSAIAALQRVVQLDSKNPYAYAYLAFVNLYDFRPQAAQQALAPALQLKPDSQELQLLDGVTALMRGNLVKAWRVLQAQNL
jgi:4-amino-4-deoxy-L-arabinose transferase-like glycosyltransferase